MRGGRAGEKDGRLRFRHPSGAVTTTWSNSKEWSVVLTTTVRLSLVSELLFTVITLVERRMSALLRAVLATRLRMAL